MKLIVLLAALLVAPTPVAGAPGCTAQTSLGTVAGRAAGHLCVYRGIRYADAPRSRPPVPVGPWSGTFEATDASAVCPQFRDDVSEEYPDDRPVYLDEDCLRLNVWAPRGPGGHPVVVFVHGGAARFGTANEPRYDGTRPARDAVVVTLNYRLGLLGADNLFLRDQITALEWVRAHIASFGGDPGNVTAVGESEGAFSLSAMLATDHPQRLFRRVVLQSGSGYLVHSGPEPAVDLTGMSTLEVLRRQEELVGADPLAGAVHFGPHVDGELVRRPVIDAVEAGNARGIDVLIGSNRDEMGYFAQFDLGIARMTLDRYRAFFPPGLDLDEVAAAYRDEPDEVLAMLTDQTMRVPATRLAEAQGRWARSFMYRFDWGPAVHTAELPFVFGTLSFTGVPGGAEAFRADPAAARALSAGMRHAWASFARSGDPGWPEYRYGRATRTWDTPSGLVFAPGEAQRAAWDGYDFRYFR
ncbi:carboxylesterase/lipase family protein [Saccharothrix syringae]|uniref:Carboxylesterase/lipase family protein n=1 Tax=Saccharothrix syringae TaxID=103733 RepID=A0A5Q0GXS7_SACSY|nr:carboxylesterase family protein [Saccharothrix syringae]QFZ18866.1 carboxylesterase/lipase family protein [Saccharothrix syringae]